jgi:hypothetical protein
MSRPEIEREIMRQAQRVISDEYTKRLHPSFINKTIGNDHLSRLKGAVEVSMMLFHDFPSEDARAKVIDAYAAAGKWL